MKTGGLKDLYTLCLKVIVFSCVLIVASLNAHQKDGLFVEGGLITGMLEHSEFQRHEIPTPKHSQEKPLEKHPKNLCDEVLCMSNAYYLSHASELLDPSKNAAGITFSTKNIIETSIKNNTLQVENFLPYNLSNVNLVMHINGKNIVITHLQELPQFSQAKFSLEMFPILKPYEHDRNVSFSVEFTQDSSLETKRVLEAINLVKVNIIGTFSNEPTGDKYPVTEHGKTKWVSDYVPVTGKLARDYIDVLLNVAYLFSSKEWKKALEDAPFAFVNATSPFDPRNCAKDRADFDTCKTNADPNIYGQAPAWCKTDNQKDCHVWTPKQVWENFTNQCGFNTENTAHSFDDCLNIQGNLKDTNNTDFGSVKLNLGVINTNANVYGRGWYGSLGLDEDFLKQSAKIWHTWSWKDEWPLYDIFHEYGHTRGYSHNGDMTYPTGGSMYKICEGSNHTNCHEVHAGYAGLSEEVLMQLAKENKLPINYATLSSQQTPKYGFNVPVYGSNFGVSLPKIMVLNPTQNTNSVVGADVKMGYQQYFNDFFGLAYYGIFKYNYTNARNNIGTINQYSYGVGTDLLVDFLNTYTGGLTGNFVSSLGSFVGLRAFYNNYQLMHEIKNRGNVNMVFGFNYRYKHSKYSIGASLPLIQQAMELSLARLDTLSVVSFDMGVSHFDLFFNYGWVF
ncbi:outer membrane beta-barrel protein [Helicobacter cetorum]|uniref:Putative outer membrane protein HomB n=1 Tax=Helicobacter cetorum (strain ATCC BAA-540 / CCUG 52418 / MIT 99-5656) TaxID=1163745 RepID=I0ET49_HELCM|nr:outer membrane beta-barrel protein [Helicobacter cetorum]AFI06118.1 putative outer membrane protein HomB [Helicobacter cetorum MIT 99-5656]